jgi:hypothetical protein
MSFDELVKQVDTLSSDELYELRKILNEKRELEILADSEQAMKEYREGKTISLQSEEEIREYFHKLMNEND